MTTTTIAENISNVLKRVRLAAAKSQRKPEEIRILAVSKTRPTASVRAAFEQGLVEFGENYLSEALEKIEALADLDITWHFIGPIQSNKTRAIAENFSWVHSVDRARIARRLSEQRPGHLPPLQVCVQVNISGETSKSGLAPGELPALASEIASLPNLDLRGLMAIPAATSEHPAQHSAFAQLRHLLNELSATHAGLDTLSMGMSGDMEAAIEEGATIVRIGTDIFGPRNA